MRDIVGFGLVVIAMVMALATGILRWKYRQRTDLIATLEIAALMSVIAAFVILPAP